MTEEEALKHVASPEPEKPEGFLSRHVKGVTFGVCVAVFLAACVLIGYFALGYDRNSDDRKELTVEDVILMNDAEKPILGTVLDHFAGTRDERKNGDVVEIINYRLFIGDDYILTGVVDAKTGYLISLDCYSGKTKTHLDVLKDDARAFFENN